MKPNQNFFEMDVFKFDITQTSKVMLYKIEVNAGKKWRISGDMASGNFKLIAINDDEKYIDVVVDEVAMVLTTVRGYRYKIYDKPKDGATVFFYGPINALLVQALLPKMTYVAGTLMAMADGEEEWTDIVSFGQIRRKRSEGENPQDRHGYKVNAKVNNEIPFFPPSHAIKAKPVAEEKKKKGGKFKR